MSAGRLRLFFALELTHEASQQVRRALAPLRDMDQAVRWLSPETLHLTLRFLGDVQAEGVPTLINAVSDALDGQRPLELELAAGGCFPRRGPPRVLWLGVAGNAIALRELARAIDEAVVRLGFEPLPRSYKPHLTVARIKRGGARGTVEALGRLSTFGRFRVDEVVLLSSELRAEGARYTAIARFPLAACVSD